MVPRARRGHLATLAAAALTALSWGAPLAVAALTDRSPRLEKLVINPADSSRAAREGLRPGDLPSGWTGGRASTANDLPPDCAWQDYSAYTITGQAEDDFRHGPITGLLTGSAEVLSGVQIFATPAQAAGDLAVDKRPGTAECEGKTAGSIGTAATVLFARRLAGPSVGSDRVAYLIAVRVGANVIYVSLLEFVRGRSLGTLIALNPGSPQKQVSALAQLMDRRMRAA